MERATIFDYNRMCFFYSKTCQDCPLDPVSCADWASNYDVINATVIEWTKAHPAETNFEHFKKMFPNCKASDASHLKICPQLINKKFFCDIAMTCEGCKKHFWESEYICF